MKNLNKLVTTFWERSLTLIAIGAVGLVTLLFRRSPVAERDQLEMAGGDRRSFAAAVRTEPAEPAKRAPLLERLFERERILWWWAGIVVVVLLTQNPMFRNHLTALVAPLSLLVAALPAVVACRGDHRDHHDPVPGVPPAPVARPEGLLRRRRDRRRRVAKAAGRRVRR